MPADRKRRPPYEQAEVAAAIRIRRPRRRVLRPVGGDPGTDPVDDDVTFRARDPGVRGGAGGSRGPDCRLERRRGRDVHGRPGRTSRRRRRSTTASGPRFNFVGCAGCHSQPAVGGTSPAVNPLFRVPGDLGFTGNVIPSFITRNGPIREARFQFNTDGSRDGGVHALFVITGHPDAAGCNIRQEDFERQVRNHNIIFRIPTPVFGAGLIEQITDSAILANLSANSSTKSSLGISGRPNRNGNDGTISRFGWKAQNQSLLLFSGEAYNVEMGITNELFQIERDETPSCQFATVPNDVTAERSPDQRHRELRQLPALPGAADAVRRHSGRRRPRSPRPPAVHQHRLRPLPHADAQDRQHHRGRPANQNANLFSDLALHAMGPGLADDILQGAARGDEFRTAPLWGLGQRIFFLHDGRTNDLIEAIRAHQKRRQHQVRAVGGQRRDRQVQPPRRARQAGPAQLPALALTLAPGPGRGHPRPGRRPPGPGSALSPENLSRGEQQERRPPIRGFARSPRSRPGRHG